MLLRLLPLTAAALGLAGCAADFPPRLAVFPPMTKSAVCQVASDYTDGRPSMAIPASINMNNDGGWCWMMSSGTQGGNQFGPYLKLTEPPTAGEVSVAVGVTETRVAYRPRPGFTGTDQFRTVDLTLNMPVVYTVTVTQ